MIYIYVDSQRIENHSNVLPIPFRLRMEAAWKLEALIVLLRAVLRFF